MDLTSLLEPNRVLREEIPLLPLPGQVGGQMPIFHFEAYGLVCKPAFPEELAFYEGVLPHQAPELRPFVPDYHGLAYLPLSVPSLVSNHTLSLSFS